MAPIHSHIELRKYYDKHFSLHYHYSLGYEFSPTLNERSPSFLITG